MFKDAFKQKLETHTFGQNLFVFESTDSTNTRAKERLKESALPEGSVFVALSQTAGRGTRGRSWESNTAESLLFSLVLQTPLQQKNLSFLPAIALVRTLRKFAGLDAHVKWPNDVLVDQRKLAGILCESVNYPNNPNQSMAWIVGVGVNINQVSFPSVIAEQAVSLRQIMGKSYSIEALFQAYLLEMERLYYSKEDLISLWLTCTKMLGKTILTKKNGVQRELKVVNLSLEGYLILEDANGKLETWMSSTYLEIGTKY